MRCPAAVKPATIVKADAAHKKDPKFSGTVEEAGRGVSMEFAEYKECPSNIQAEVIKARQEKLANDD